MTAHPIVKSFNQIGQWSSIGFRKRHDAATLQMFDKPLCPSQIAAIAAAKGMRATACDQVIGKGVEHALIELFYSNLFNRGPFSQVCCTAQDQLRRPASESQPTRASQQKGPCSHPLHTPATGAACTRFPRKTPT